MEFDFFLNFMKLYCLCNYYILFIGDPQILKAGHKLIYSASWYLDHLQSGGDWINFYKVDPRQMIPSSQNKLNLEDIVGGEACMWGEVVDDRNIQSR